MKATKKIVGAACALVAAVALSAGSTFAWFSSNGEVTATGLEVDVNTSNAYLIISDSTDFSGKLKTISLAPTTVTKLLPSAYETTATLDPADDTCITKVGNWYTGEGEDTEDGTLVTSTKAPLTAENFSSYVVMDDIFVSVAPGSMEVTHVNLTVEAKHGETTGWDTTNGNSPISVVLLYQTITTGSDVGAWTKVELNAANNHTLTGGKLDLGALQADGADYIQLKVMVYFDGNNEAVTTKNSANLNGVTLDFKFVDGSDSGSES